jgi:hypothetical protein
MNKDIEEALQRLRCASGKYAKTERYYRGDHDLAFAREKFENAFGTLFRAFAMNLCPGRGGFPPTDSVYDRPLFSFG